MYCKENEKTRVQSSSEYTDDMRKENTVDGSCESSRYLISSHHLHEFIEINSSWAVSINFLNDAVQIGAGEFVIKGTQDFLEGRGGDVAVTFTIVETESFLQFSEKVWKV